MALNTRRKTMKAWSVIGLLCAATIFAMVPISPQVTSRGVELSVDQAQAVTYRRARVTAPGGGGRGDRPGRRPLRPGDQTRVDPNPPPTTSPAPNCATNLPH